MADTKIAENFSNLPMEALISAPLVAAANSNLSLAKATYDFIEEVWRDKDGKPRMLQFPLQRPSEVGGVDNVEVNAPFAALIETPNLMVRSVDINFTMEVKDTSQHTDSTTVKVDTEFSATGVWWSAKLTGSLSTTSSNTRSSDQSAKYEVRVRAEQAQATEGMNRLAQVFASCIDPIKKSGKE